MSSRDQEVEKYVAAYRNREYRMGPTRRVDVERVLRSLPKGSLLDVGTGRGETLTIATAIGHAPVKGTEVVPYLLRPPVIEYAQAHALPFGDGEFDHVTCFDVLEHLLDEDLVPALREFQRVARGTVTVSAAVKSHVYQGVELHPSARSFEAWHELIVMTWGGGFRNGNAGKYSGLWQLIKEPTRAD